MTQELAERAPFAWLRERDIDLLFCAELHARGVLVRLLAETIDAADAVLSGAWVSHSDFDGESDLVVELSHGGRKALLLVENKIAASFQPDQAARYIARARRMSESHGISRVATVLLAPREYRSRRGAELFEFFLSYENVAEALRSEHDARSAFLADTLDTGILAYRQGYVMVPDAVVTAIWRACWLASQKVAPRLNFREPGVKPGQSTWIYFREAEGFEGDIRRAAVVYKAERGQVDLQFRSTLASALHARAQSCLDRTMKVVRANKSASIRVEVPAVDFGAPAEGQEAAILEGFAACERLRSLFVEQRSRLLGDESESTGGP